MGYILPVNVVHPHYFNKRLKKPESFLHHVDQLEKIVPVRLIEHKDEYITQHSYSDESKMRNSRLEDWKGKFIDTYG